MKESNKHNDEIFFVQVKSPSEIRRHILEILRDIVQILQRFEKFKHTRQEKIAEIHKLRNLLRDTNKTIGSLKIKLPRTNLKVAIPKEAPVILQKSGAKKKKKEKHSREKAEKTLTEAMPKREMTELEKLEAELNSIEDKLKDLT